MAWAPLSGRDHGRTPEGSKPHTSFEACSFLDGDQVTYGFLGLRFRPEQAISRSPHTGRYGLPHLDLTMGLGCSQKAQSLLEAPIQICIIIIFSLNIVYVLPYLFYFCQMCIILDIYFIMFYMSCHVMCSSLCFGLLIYKQIYIYIRGVCGSQLFAGREHAAPILVPSPCWSFHNFPLFCNHSKP